MLLIKRTGRPLARYKGGNSFVHFDRTQKRIATFVMNDSLGDNAN